MQGKIAGAEWKTLSPEEKAKYEKMAAVDKERYQNEMKDYTPPSGTAAAVSGKSGNNSKKPAAAKKKKDPNAPKKALTAFMYFSTEVRPKIKKENPTMSFGDLGKKIGELYRALSADEKKRFEDMAKTDKERYKKAQGDFEKSSTIKKAEDDGVDDSDDDDDDSDVASDKNDDSDSDDDDDE